MLQEGQLGVHPPGALGVAFFVHAGAECFVGRCGDGITDPLKEVGSLTLDEGGGLRSVPLRERIFSNLLEADARERMPEALLVCCNPDQLGLFTAEMVRFLENLCERRRLSTADDVRRRVPILLILPNGILAEQTVQTYEEQLRESRLMGRLPGVGEDLSAALLDRVVRGVSLQAGGRRGGGAEAVYVLERKGKVVFAGGGETERERLEAILTGHHYPYHHARKVPGTRVEFDKAMISIVLNVGGLIHMVRPDGELIDLRMGDLCKDPTKAEFVERITRALFDVGQAAGAYPREATYEEIWSEHRATILAHADHVTSSVKSFRDALTAGLTSVRLFSNEEWILTPLARYAAKAGLSAEEHLFQSLKQQVQESMARAIRGRAEKDAGAQGRNGHMRLTAQRDFSIELFDAGPDNTVAIGTMLDDDHLIKLELNIYLPDEQITRSRLEMIRAPFPVCAEIEAAADRLIGLRIERGVVGEINRRVGGRTGCSHIKELATNIVYFAASRLVRRRIGLEPVEGPFGHRPPEERFALTKELLRDSCLAYCQTTPLGLDERVGIRRVGEEHTCPLPLGGYEPSLGMVLRDRARRWGDRTYVRFRRGEQVVSLTWREFAEQTWQIAQNLIGLGIRPGDFVCMMSENRVEMLQAELAVMSIGAVTVPIFAGAPAAQAAHVLGHSRPRLVVVSGPHQLEKIERERYPSIERYYVMDSDAETERRGALHFAALLSEPGRVAAGAAARAELLDRRIDAVRPDDLAVVMYTSGTTGPPKGVQLCHGNLISQQKALSLLWDVREGDAVMNYLPWHHSFGGLFERFMTLYQGAELCLDDSRGRDIDRLIDNWRVFDPTVFCSVPRVHDQLMNRCRQDSALARIVLGGRLRFVFTAGAALPAGVEAEYRRHNIPVLEGWGLTETSPCAALRSLGTTYRSGTVGTPIPGVTVRIDSDQEILVRGPNVMLGYLHDEEATAHVLSKDGWLRTGDLGEYAKDGLRLLGRKDGAFKLTTGEKVHPQRIETVLVSESPFISDAVAVGAGQDFVGALLFPDFGRLEAWAAEQGLPRQGLVNHPAVVRLYAAQLQRTNPWIEVKYQRIRRAILADEPLSAARGEVTPSGKLVRRAVLETYKRKLDALFRPLAGDGVIEVPQEEPPIPPVESEREGALAHAG